MKTRLRSWNCERFPVSAMSPDPNNRPGTPPKPTRFYKEVAVGRAEGGHTVLLDGRPIKTPARAALVLPSARLAEAVAAEWAAQDEHIDPASMWLTKLANTAVDRVATRRDEVIGELLGFAGADLVCYRADHPQELADRQEAVWGPLLDWIEKALDVRFAVTQGLAPITQPRGARDAVETAFGRLDAFSLTGLHNAVTLTGSAVIGLALVHRRLDADAAFDAAHIDEAWQAEHWCEDAEA